MKAEVLVTGASGYLGRHLMTAFKESGVPAAALVRKSPERTLDAVIIEGTPLAAQTWQGAAAEAKVHTIVHAAAIVRHSRTASEDMIEVNVGGTLEVVRAAKEIGARVLLVSTSGTVGCYRHADLAADEHAPFSETLAGRWPYYGSKIRAEREGRQLADKLGVPFFVARLPVLLGPDDHGRRSTGHVSRVLQNRVPFIPSGGMHFTDVRDVAAAIVRLTQKKSPRSIYHFPGTATSLAGIFNLVCEVSGATVTTRRAPALLLNSVASVSDRLIRGWSWRPPHWLPDPVILEMAACHWGLSTLWTHSDLGYSPRPARQTLNDTVTWLRQQGEQHA